LDVLGVELIAADDASAPRRLAVSEGNQMRLLLIGAPGAGKGTQAERLAERFGITHISSGDLLRQHVKDRTSIGRMVTSYLDRGDLVPDGVVMDMLRKPVVAAAQAGGYVLDGFPRTVEQARASFPTAHALGVEVQAAVHLDVARAELKRRLLARRRGSEDTEAVIERRLQVYLDKTVPLLEYYADREWMFTVDGAQPPDAVYEDIVACLEGWWTSLRGPGQASRASGR
jgi:adenylate kinase